METELLFQLNLKWDNTTYKPLKELAIREYYDYDLKRYKWVFKVKDLHKVLAILGKEITFHKEEIIPLIKRCPYIKEKIETDKYKGTGMLEITEFPNLFLVETIINKKKVPFKIPRETVEKLWDVVKRQPLDKPVKTRTVAENFMKELGVTRFNRGKIIYEEKDIRILSTKEESFDFSKVFGSRSDYFIFYFSIKTLEYYGIIKYHKYGAVERIKDEWVLEKRFVEPIVKG